MYRNEREKKWDFKSLSNKKKALSVWAFFLLYQVTTKGQTAPRANVAPRDKSLDLTTISKSSVPWNRIKYKKFAMDWHFMMYLRC